MAVSSAASCGALLGEILDEKENALFSKHKSPANPSRQKNKAEQYKQLNRMSCYHF